MYFDVHSLSNRAKFLSVRSWLRSRCWSPISGSLDQGRARGVSRCLPSPRSSIREKVIFAVRRRCFLGTIRHLIFTRTLSRGPGRSNPCRQCGTLAAFFFRISVCADKGRFFRVFRWEVSRLARLSIFAGFLDASLMVPRGMDWIRL